MLIRSEGFTNTWPIRVLSHTEDLLHILACSCLVLLTFLITIDVISRTLFNTPLHIQFELTELYLMPAIAALSLSRVYRDRAHLSLEVITPDKFGRAWPYLQSCILAISAIFFILLAWRSGVYAYKALASNATYFGIYDWPLGLAYASIPVGSGLLALRLFSELMNTIFCSTFATHYKRTQKG